MAEIPGFWDIGPHSALPVERTWQEFVQKVGGELVSALLPKSPDFDNADFIFREAGVIAELKEVETEFSRSARFKEGLGKLVHRIVAEDPEWRPELAGGSGRYPRWFLPEFVRLFRKPIARILEKSNRQLRETKRHFGIQSATGVLLLVNDGFTSIGPNLIQGLAATLLSLSYSSIDGFVYLTLNRYVELRGCNVPMLMWSPLYSNRAPISLIHFIDDLGRKWGSFLQERIGPFDVREETTNREILRGSKSVLLPDGRRENGTKKTRPVQPGRSTLTRSAD